MQGRTRAARARPHPCGRRTRPTPPARTPRNDALARSAVQDVLLRQMLRLPMSFYDSQPTGRLLNRFTRDVEAVDLVIIEAVRSFLACTIAYVTRVF